MGADGAQDIDILRLMLTWCHTLITVPKLAICVRIHDLWLSINIRISTIISN